MNWIQQYNGFLRSLRIFYFLFNLRNYKSLKRNIILYKQFGLKKSIFSSIQYTDFEKLDSKYSNNQMKETAFNPKKLDDSFSENQQFSTSNWQSDGFMTIQNFFTEREVDSINEEMEDLLLTGKTNFNYTGRKIMQSYKYSKSVKNAFVNNKLLSVLESIMGKRVIPFHTINFFKGSEQDAHSDAFHMSTFPEGNLIAVWVALEDISEDQGPLFYYPGTHLWSQIKNGMLPLEENFWRLDGNANEKYEVFAKHNLKNAGLKPSMFLPKKGDILIWHSNLIHGGMAMKNSGLTRKSLVMHYFTEGAICFHEISQRPVVFDAQLLSELGIK